MMNWVDWEKRPPENPERTLKGDIYNQVRGNV
jgi:hypothetical protein